MLLYSMKTCAKMDGALALPAGNEKSSTRVTSKMLWF